MIGTALAAALIVTRTIIPAAKGPSRLDPDVDLIAHAQRNFADLRLHDARGAEVPYLVIEPPEAEPRWRTATALLPIVATKKESGFDADLGDAVAIDRIRIDGIAPPFLKRLRVEASGDREHWSLVAPDATVFDLPDQKLRNVTVDITPGTYRYVRVTWDDRSSAVVKHVENVVARLTGGIAPPPRIEVPVAFRKITSETGRSRYRLTLPAARLPLLSIDLQIANGDVYRDASILEPRLGGSVIAPVTLGTSTLRRATRDGSVAADLSIPIGAPQSADLDLVVDDANNPPLPIASIVARLTPQPWIYFDSDGAPLTATYGDVEAKPARYDLEASRRFASTAKTATARWTPASVAPRPNAVEAAALPIIGAPIDRKPFRFAREIDGAPRGLTSLVLDLDVLAHSESLQDVRIVDEKNTQVPYVVEHRDAPLAVKLPIASKLHFALPYDTLPSGTRLVLTTNARVFQRRVTLRSAADESRGREARVLSIDDWGDSDPNQAAPPLTITPALRGIAAIDVDIENGDNAPLPITSAELLVPSYALRFYGSGSKLTLLYAANVAAPRYDLALLAPRLFGETANEITLQPAPAKPASSSPFETKLFWIVIGVAAVALLAVLAKLLANVSA